MQTGSVRFRVTALATVIVALVLLAVAVVLIAVQRATLTRALDDGLRQRADAVASQIAETGLATVLPGASDESATQLVDPSGRVVAASSNVEGAPPMGGDASGHSTIARVRIDALGDDAFRVVFHRVTAGDAEYELRIAVAADDIDDSVRILAISLGIAVPVAVALLTAVVWWITGRALRPVESIRAEVASISSGDLARRVPVPPGDDEVAALAQTMNAMLTRIEEGVARQERFVADASHELRSPLTRIRSELEVDLSGLDDADLAATHRSVLQEAVEMQQLIDGLLYLARSDAGRQQLKTSLVDLDDLVLDEIAARRTDRITVDTSGLSAAQVTGDRGQLARAIGNVLDNALRHARTSVVVNLREEPGVAVLSVADDGPGIPPDRADAVFERFTRIDEGRDRHVGGAGLGLAIAADIVERHGGQLHLDPSHRGGARFIMRLPPGDSRIS